MHLIVGLGNPGKKHENNRHNIGFMAIENIVQKHGLSSPRSRFLAETYETIIGGNKILLLKPSTFMNESGKAVYQAANFYKVPSEKIIIFHDEIDLIEETLKSDGIFEKNNWIESARSLMIEGNVDTELKVEEELEKESKEKKSDKT